MQAAWETYGCLADSSKTDHYQTPALAILWKRLETQLRKADYPSGWQSAMFYPCLTVYTISHSLF